MDLQQTLRHPVSLEGIGLHSGDPVKMTVSPAAADTGVLFRASDGTLIPANTDHVVDSNSATTVGAFGVRVRTIEHLMAAAAALGIDNMIVDIDGPEVPAADGSAKPFMDLLRSGGRVTVPAPRRPIVLSAPIRVGTESRWLEVLPADSLRISYTLDNSHPIIGLQVGTYGITEETFAHELAAARTYGFLRDVPAMRRNGLARGGSLENAVVVGKRSVLNDSLRYPDEFVRHKILDLVGDLFLLGRPLRAHVVGRNAGHALNYQLVAAIQKAVAADRRRMVARATRPAVPAPVASTGDGFLPGVAAL
ncbi:MAG TPA: UDP-3-O-acyl-N-acetylglucosamine deacetylase [Methylomirabilota bacterium]|jgi:UDP-3-O-acyl N-acetylglucosamine deacetylase|nr:UDP-3-O-acyl-N-acetylglucosamine deacetylase [Methylomirabilota bacterium]